MGRNVQKDAKIIKGLISSGYTIGKIISETYLNKNGSLSIVGGQNLSKSLIFVKIVINFNEYFFI